MCGIITNGLTWGFFVFERDGDKRVAWNCSEPLDFLQRDPTTRDAVLTLDCCLRLVVILVEWVSSQSRISMAKS